jgi:SAM-dependent methyltransferase
MEILDGDGVGDGELARTLALVTEVNRRLGGVRSLKHHLRSLRDRREVQVLDVGTGSAEVLRDILAWGGGSWSGVGVDLSAAALRVASDTGDSRETGPNLVRGDALHLPFPDDAFAASFGSLTLHHFTDDEATRVLAEMARVSRELVVMSDLERSLPAYVGARILAATRWRRDRITRHDGPLSVRRSFTPAELRTLGRRAGLRSPRVRRHFPFRLVLAGAPA